MRYQKYPSDERGQADYQWLKTFYSFSFAGWYHPAKVHFGMLRVLNDDIIAPGTGFDMHPHNDMEIITFLNEGSLKHTDNMGNSGIIKKGEVQVMSAGRGVFHSEKNPSNEQSTHLFQLWIFPKEKNIDPRYDQKSFSDSISKNTITTLVSGFKKPGTLYIHQDAEISIADMEAGKSLDYTIAGKNNGAYLMVIHGQVTILDLALNSRDALGAWDTSTIPVKASTDARILVIDVPMN